jgi:ComF family protein
MTETRPSLSPLFADWSLTFKNLFLPQFCRQCDARILTEENSFFCPTCWEMSPDIERPFCSVCGRPHAETLGFGPPTNYPCAACREADIERPYDRIFGAAKYEGPVAEIVKLLKFNDRPRAAALLAERMVALAEREGLDEAYDILAPVPLHTVRLRARGFNQAELLAHAIAPAFPSASVDTSLRRIRPTRTQSRMDSPEAREANVRGAFAVDRESDLSGLRVLLIDDVVTTAVTAAECARALRRAGAARVDVFAASLACGPNRLDVT